MKFIVLFFLIGNLSIYSQTNISGYINIEKVETSKKVFISRRDINGKYNIVTTTNIDNNGFFNINTKLPFNNTLYKISINDTKDQNSKYFVLSNNDSLQFKISKNPFLKYSNTNPIDKEWQKLKNFKEDLTTQNTENYLEKIRQYSKDSLKTLAIKLLSVKELNEKKLLQEDISLNKNYYIRFLNELKSSEINNVEYYFLEKELALQSLREIEKKHFLSKIINFILFLIIVILFYFIYLFKFKNNIINIEELSKQEINIKKLIIEGKTNKEISESLFISLSTVKTHITSIYNKLRISNRNELITKFGK